MDIAEAIAHARIQVSEMLLSELDADLREILEKFEPNRRVMEDAIVQVQDLRLLRRIAEKTT